MVDSRPQDIPDFDALVLPHRDAAFNLALWLVSSRADAEDVTQEALVRAWRALPRLRGGSTRAWLLKIVRNTAYTHIGRRQRAANVVSLDDAARRRGQKPAALDPVDDAPDAERLLIDADEKAELAAALARLPLHLKETIVLREMEDLSYQEIASVMDVPVGTVMSRLARGREQLRREFMASSERGGGNRAL